MFSHTLVIRVCKIIRLLFQQQHVIPTHAKMEEHVNLTLMIPAVTVAFVHGDMQDYTVKVSTKSYLSYLDESIRKLSNFNFQ